MARSNTRNGLYMRRYKTALCENWSAGRPCAFGDDCLFAHGSHELRTVEQNIARKSPPPPGLQKWLLPTTRAPGSTTPASQPSDASLLKDEVSSVMMMHHEPDAEALCATMPDAFDATLQDLQRRLQSVKARTRPLTEAWALKAAGATSRPSSTSIAHSASVESSSVDPTSRFPR